MSELIANPNKKIVFSKKIPSAVLNSQIKVALTNYLKFVERQMDGNLNIQLSGDTGKGDHFWPKKLKRFMLDV